MMLGHLLGCLGAVGKVLLGGCYTVAGIFSVVVWCCKWFASLFWAVAMMFQDSC